MNNYFQKHPYPILFVLVTMVNLIGIVFVPLMDVDATQYASISMEMLQNGSWLQVMHHGHDYLDKPPLLFWLGALSYKLFGLHAWAYRLPSFLISLLGVYSTYRLSKLFYSETISKHAALILYSCQALFLMHHDVRTDTILTGFIVFSTWHLMAYLRSNSWLNWLGAFTGIALGMLEKGPLGIVVPVAAVGTHILISRDWKNLFRWQWLPGIIWVGLLLTPMCIGLYEQFDLQPEKSVNGRQGVSGLRFFFWEQSFGRITGENVWKDDSTPLFFTHSFIWSFLPWSILAVVAFFQKLKELVKLRFHSTSREFLSLGGFLIPFAALSFSHYKLPHYVFVTYPFAAIFTALWLEELFNKASRQTGIWYTVQTTVALLLIILSSILNAWSFPFFTEWQVMLPLFVLLLLMLGLLKNSGYERLLRLISYSTLSAVYLNLLLNSNFYPRVLEFQSGTQVAKFLEGTQLRQGTCFTLKGASFALDACSRQIWMDGSPEIFNEVLKQKGELWIYTDEEGYAVLKTMFPGAVVEDFKHYHPTELSFEFLNPKTRFSVLKTRYLFHVTLQQGTSGITE